MRKYQHKLIMIDCMLHSDIHNLLRVLSWAYMITYCSRWGKRQTKSYMNIDAYNHSHRHLYSSFILVYNWHQLININRVKITVNKKIKTNCFHNPYLISRGHSFYFMATIQRFSYWNVSRKSVCVPYDSSWSSWRQQRIHFPSLVFLLLTTWSATLSVNTVLYALELGSAWLCV